MWLTVREGGGFVCVRVCVRDGDRGKCVGWLRIWKLLQCDSVKCDLPETLRPVRVLRQSEGQAASSSWIDSNWHRDVFDICAVQTGNSISTFRNIFKGQRWDRSAVPKCRNRITSLHCAKYQKSVAYGAEVASQIN